ncbi:MAG: tRNA (N(6)-L-threonylcarbamoyladenosine(37)-C(2))-methylthiotransferase [Candidatus Woesearchaeota archaeon]
MQKNQKKVFIKTYGCSFNVADSENMAGLLKESGYKIVDNEKDADLVIINSCTVKNNAETKFWRDVKNIKKPKILAGCVPQAETDKTKFSGFSVIGTNQITKVVEVTNQTLSGNVVQLLTKEKNPRLNIPKVRKNSVIEILPINEGCLGSCTFCKTKFARGHLYSYELDAIAKQAREALNEGVKEIWLTSQDTACYGYDIGTNIVELIKKILEMKREFKLRLGMGNPEYFKKQIDNLLPLFQDKRLFRFLHIPLQAGSNKVLKDMKREYSVEEYLELIKKIKSQYPDMTLSTDIICGFPTESNSDFEMTLKIIEEIKPDVLNISRFWPRPGTKAAKLKQLPSEVIKDRSIKLRNLFYKVAKENNKKWFAWKGEILIDEIGKNNSFIGRNYAYKPVIIKKSDNIKLGDFVNVEIVKTETHDLRAVKL